ncbi:MAG: SusC/RagA family TonB-linked outer membrane protein, partial [bacterium]
TSSKSELDIALEEDVLKVSEIVVTGLATSVKRRNLANSVGTVSAKELIPAPAQTLDRALSGKMAGITISQNTGAPGGGINVNLRGLSTITGNTQPLFVVDGVIINDEAIQSGLDLVTEATGAGSPRPQGQPTNRIADINPNDIANIEVLKGASAAAIYGSKATNGVVLITTKQGTPGKTRIDVTQQLGFSTILNKIGTRRFDAQKASDLRGQEGLDIFNANGGKFIDQEEVLFGNTGFLTESTLSIRGGTERTQFYIGGLAEDDNGIIDKTGYQKFSGKVNVNHRISDRLKLSAFSTFTRTRSDRSITGNDNTNTTLGFSLANTPSFLDLRPKNGVFPEHPFNLSNPVETIALLKNRERVDRTLGSVRAEWNVVRTERQALDFILQGGVDFLSQESFVFAPPELQFERTTDLPGEAVSGRTRSTFSNLYLHANYSLTTSSNIGFRTSAGVQFENRRMNNNVTDANGLVPGQSNVDQASSVDVFQTITKQRERGLFVQEEVDIKDVVYLTAAFRGDASSANGNVNHVFIFPKASGSVRLSELPFWERFSGIAQEFKLRAAYGETGNLPRPEAKFTNLTPFNISGRTGLLPSTRRGDSNIKPERTKEFEIGFDATIFHGNGTLEFSYYRQTIEDLILETDLAPSSGALNLETNAGEMRTVGYEVSLGLTPIRSKLVNWTSRVNFFKTTSEVTKLNVDPFNLGGFATFLGTFRIEEGRSPTTIIGSEKETLPDGTVRNKALGNGTPDFNMAFNNNVTFGSFELSFLWEWSKGGNVVNLGKLLTDIGGTSPDFDEVKTYTLPDGSTVTGKKGIQRLNLLGTLTAPYIESATYLKLRELSLSYNLPHSIVNGLSSGQLSYIRLGVAARNLIMWTPYDGYDPEVSQFGNVGVGRAIDTLPFPSSKNVYFNIAFGL